MTVVSHECRQVLQEIVDALAGNGSPHEFRSLLIAPELQSPHRRNTIDLSIISIDNWYIETSSDPSLFI